MKVVIFYFLMVVLCSSNVAAQVGNSEKLNSNDTLRGRDRGLAYSAKSSQMKTTVGATGSSDESSSTSDLEINFGYQWNKYEYEYGIQVSKDTGSSSVETDLMSFGVMGQYNFVPNKAPNNLIPYMAFQMEYAIGTIEASSETLNVSGMAYQLLAGMLWFPFSEIFCLDLSLGFGNAKLQGGNSSIDLDMGSNGTTLSAGWRIYF